MNAYTGQVPDTEPAVDWRMQGLCRGEDPEDFFPVGSTPAAKAAERHAKAICWTCPVMQPCGQWAIANREPVGVWGGMSEAERRTILRRRGIRLPEIS